MKYLYHGSPHKLRGDKLLPTKPDDLEKKKWNLHFGVYATNIKEAAISMAIICSKGVLFARLKTAAKDPAGIIYKGWPKQDYIYLYTLSNKGFKNIPKSSNQYISPKAVKPLLTEKLRVKDYLYLIRKATQKERKEWIRKFGKL